MEDGTPHPGTEGRHGAFPGTAERVRKVQCTEKLAAALWVKIFLFSY
jgi:hypothetical protein